MKAYLVLSCSVAMVVALGVTARPRLNSDAKSCRARSDVAGKCFIVHGRLSVYNGTPSIRLWPVGSRRMLGIIDPKDVSNASGPSVLPEAVRTKLDADKDVFGDFLVCPLSPRRTGRMQTVCIESGKNLRVQEHK